MLNSYKTKDISIPFKFSSSLSDAIF